MTEGDFAAVQAAVTLARDRQITNAKALRDAIVAQGFSQEEAGRALVFWGGYERAKTERKEPDTEESEQ